MLLTTGQLVRVTFGQVTELDQLQQFLSGALGVGLLADTEGDVFRHTQVGEQGVILEHHADMAFLRRKGKTGAGNHFTCQFDLAFQDWLETGDGAQGGGLAAARWAEQAADVARVEVQVEILHHLVGVVAAV